MTIHRLALKFSETSGGAPRSKLRGMQGAVLVEIQQIHLFIAFLLFRCSLCFNIIAYDLSLYSSKEARFHRDSNHCISKKLVAKAKDTSSLIVLEDLKGFREKHD